MKRDAAVGTPAYPPAREAGSASCVECGAELQASLRNRTEGSKHHWRNTVMTLAQLTAQAPSAYELLRRIGLDRRRSAALRAASRAGWVGLGVAIGGSMALLLAPRSGSETREKLGETARRARDYVAPETFTSKDPASKDRPNASYARTNG